MAGADSRDAVTIAQLIRVCQDIGTFIAGLDRETFFTTPVVLSAVCFKLAVLGEAAMRLSETLTRNTLHIPWADIRGMRNRLVHGYDRVDLSEVWKTARADVPVLLRQLTTIQNRPSA